MRRVALTLACIAIVLLTTACGNVSRVEVVKWAPSDIYTDAEIKGAIRSIKGFFMLSFRGCSLKRLEYPGDEYISHCKWTYEAKRYSKTILLDSTFDVDASGGDGSFEPNSTCSHWEWLLGEDDLGLWHVLDYGYH